jgi:hypothetical protein
MTILWWIIGVGLALVALKLLIVWAEPYMSFVPRRGPTPPPPGFTALHLQSPDGTRLSGWRTEIPVEGPVFLYFCGNAGNLDDRRDLLARAAEAGLAIVAFDYRGAGESKGRATEAHVYADADAICRFMVDSLGIAPERIVLWGHSIGGAVAIALAHRRPCAGVIAEATFRSARVMARRMLPFLPAHWFMTYRFDNEGTVPDLACPILFVHGSDDLTIPASDSQFLCDIAGERGDLWLVDGADHNNVFEVAGDQFYTRLLLFAQQVTSPTLRAR